MIALQGKADAFSWTLSFFRIYADSGNISRFLVTAKIIASKGNPCVRYGDQRVKPTQVPVEKSHSAVTVENNDALARWMLLISLRLTCF